MKGRVLAILALVVVVVGVGGALVSRQVTGTVFGIGEADEAPAGVRIRVQVLNATTTRGLAQRATALLRDKGFDVVEIGNSRDRSDSTVVLDRTNHPEWARRVAAAMGGAQVIVRPDTSRYLDITVLVGSTWRPPAQPFHP
ncbi:MAG TPA: LytR C-terminal domain-containing protein [Gemmatimonadaceae bacterium]|nr:LytR C-terminal domain-containing protein [Gemmatimonadaceae bacterium]